jgi:hypothetical protein
VKEDDEDKLIGEFLPSSAHGRGRPIGPVLACGAFLTAGCQVVILRVAIALVTGQQCALGAMCPHRVID